MNWNISHKTAFVLSGGGSCGAVQVGMLRELLRFGVVPDFVVGSSVGAINGAYFAGAPTPGGVAKLEALWRGIRRDDVFPFSFASLVRLMRGDDALLDPAPVRALLERNFGDQRLERSRLQMHVVATDVRDGAPVGLCRGRVVEALMASIAIPAVFPPVLSDGRWLIDGGVADNTPARIARELGATRIVVLPAASWNAPARPNGALGLALHAVSLLLAGQTRMQLQYAAGDAELAVAPLPDVSVSPFNFSKTSELIDAAAERTRCWLRAGGLSEGWASSGVELRAAA